MAKEGNWSYLGLAYRLRPKITEKEVTMFQDPYLTEDDLAFIAEDIGPQLLKHFKPEARVAGLKPSEVLTQYKPEEVLAQYSLEELEAYVRQQKQNTNGHP